MESIQIRILKLLEDKTLPKDRRDSLLKSLANYGFMEKRSKAEMPKKK
jgi:hypothetical protein